MRECTTSFSLRSTLALEKESIGSIGVVVDPLDEGAVAFCKKFGFIVLSGNGKELLPMADFFWGGVILYRWGWSVTNQRSTSAPLLARAAHPRLKRQQINGIPKTSNIRIGPQPCVDPRNGP